jgi:hypothetical protein
MGSDGRLFFYQCRWICTFDPAPLAGLNKSCRVVTKHPFSPARTDQMFVVSKLVTQIDYTSVKQINGGSCGIVNLSKFIFLDVGFRVRIKEKSRWIFHFVMDKIETHSILFCFKDGFVVLK